VSTAVLIFVKGGKTGKVWFYDMEADGYSLDDRRNLIDGKGDIPDIIEQFKNRRVAEPIDRKAKCFYVPVEEIQENKYNLSISRYKEIEYEEIEYDPPIVIIEKIQAFESQIQQNLEELKMMLKDTR
jgi:type I restriction enzyme M protein